MLKGREKGLNVIGALEQSPLQNLSNLRDTQFRVTQTRRNDDGTKELDTVVRENDVKPNHETPAAEIVRLKEAEPQNMDFSKQFKKPENVFYETHFKLEPNGVNSKEVMDEEKKTKKTCLRIFKTALKKRHRSQIINQKGNLKKIQRAIFISRKKVLFLMNKLLRLLEETKKWH